ncbi:unnamed protein product [Didymodactylos carnosus]|uniref:Uncharacterized protein n=1 Tax=Didymodactylos carnosus TaxID=1234261 RepID=A0A813VLE4_9BILA|nr:unnamed protein product [Didymodactylos carnosus]CAF1461747.1 unnamed protein product [Didymodactylos carnosus]CAF3632433.1 unnamed protein product [Didymodactylos carnosus]CAF4254892.1 unnamed protein product [Didymodactylos carnosus]
MIKAVKPFNRTCAGYAHSNNCEYYQCFEERFPCGEKYWMKVWGYKYCERLTKHLQNFDSVGQRLVLHIKKCLFKKFSNARYYNMNEINCNQLKTSAYRLLYECYTENRLFCDAYDSNRNCFQELIDNNERHDYQAMKTMIGVANKCHPKKINLLQRSTEKCQIIV